jgi:tetratricopeptide (TPR) repeat protein
MDPELLVLAKTIDPGLLGQRLKEARLGAGLRQADVAGKHCSTAYLSRIEAGQRRPDPRLLERLVESLQISVESLLRGSGPDQRTELRLELDYAELYLSSGEPAEALDRAEKVLAAIGSSANALALDARRIKGSAEEALGRLGDAIETLVALAAEETLGALSRIDVAMALSRCYREKGDFARAISVGESALRRAAADGLEGTTECIQLMLTLAAAHHENGAIAEAVRLCETAIGRAEDLGAPSARAAAYWNASIIESLRDNVDDAVELAKKALVLFELEGEGRHLARLRSQLGMNLMRLDPPDVDAAERNLAQASIELAAANATSADVARNDLALAQAHILQGDLVEAKREADKVAEATRESVPLLSAEAQMVSAGVLATQGDVEAAVSLCRESVLLLSAMGADRAVGQLWFDLADLLDGLGEHDEAREAYRRAGVSLGLWRRLGGVPTRVST